MEVFNAKTQETQEPTWSVDQNGELVCTFEDGHFLKFPGDTTEAQLKRLVMEHQKQADGQEVITPELEAQRAKDLEKVTSLVDKLNGGTPKGSKTNAPTQDTQE